ncbi:hypothetical protein [uncultured Clostridium sp.]|nr:hypothetical protein [uncultured Clostridium sp.]
MMSKAVIIKDVGGMFNFDKMNFFEKFIIKKITKSINMKDNSSNKIDGKNNSNMINDNNIKEFCDSINEMKVK